MSQPLSFLHQKPRRPPGKVGTEYPGSDDEGKELQKISEMHLMRVAAGGRAAGEVVGGFVAVVAG